jgi:hypothetical protein
MKTEEISWHDAYAPVCGVSEGHEPPGDFDFAGAAARHQAPKGASPFYGRAGLPIFRTGPTRSAPAWSRPAVGRWAGAASARRWSVVSPVNIAPAASDTYAKA